MESIKWAIFIITLLLESDAKAEEKKLKGNVLAKRSFW
jgi:hypothetical protein